MAFFEVRWTQSTVEVQSVYVKAEDGDEAVRIVQDLYDRDELTFDPDYLDESHNTFEIEDEVTEEEAVASWVENLPNGGRPEPEPHDEACRYGRCEHVR